MDESLLTGTPPRLRLADHVRACRTDGQVILLDLHHSRYLGIAADPSLSKAVAGWPASTGEPASNSAADLDRLTAPLRAQGLLTDRRPASQPRRVHLEAPDQSLNAEDDTPSKIGRRWIYSFCRSGLAASLRLRTQTLARIAAGVTIRGDRLPTQTYAAASERTQEALAAYLRLRPFVFSTQDRCLHDALTLNGFLAAEGIRSHWVIGVKARPFAAHSWVQIGRTVLNDHHEQVQRFVPILVA